MKSAVDTSVISAIWTDQPGTKSADVLIDEARAHGRLVICGIVYSELLAHPNVEVKLVDQFLAAVGIEVDCEAGAALWHEAGIRFRRQAQRRRKEKEKERPQRRLVADFVIGAHALLHADRLITFNGADFRRDFPELLVAPEPL